MPTYPQSGGCSCGEIRYHVTEDPVTLYACHCTDCQRETGSSFGLTMVLRRDALDIVKGAPSEYEVTLADGRIKRARFCARCATRVGGPSRAAGLDILDPGSLDDTRWLRPAGHIWTRSAQPWITIPPDTIQIAEQPSDEEMLAIVRAWKREASSR